MARAVIHIDLQQIARTAMTVCEHAVDGLVACRLINGVAIRESATLPLGRSNEHARTRQTYVSRD